MTSYTIEFTVDVDAVDPQQAARFALRDLTEAIEAGDPLPVKVIERLSSERLQTGEAEPVVEVIL